MLIMIMLQKTKKRNTKNFKSLWQIIKSETKSNLCCVDPECTGHGEAARLTRLLPGRLELLAPVVPELDGDKYIGGLLGDP